jgi:predicted  nucleic acid-binding Zn-ribbon protein
MAPEDEMAMLKEDANAIRDELDAINKRIEELESQKTAE